MIPRAAFRNLKLPGLVIQSSLCAQTPELNEPWQRQIIHTPSATLELYTRGEGPPVLMHPGGGGSVWQLQELGTRVSAAGFKAVLINPRGIGASTGPLENLTLHDFASDLWAAADEFHFTRVHLLGRAFGNRVVRTASSDQPARVISLTLLAAGGEIAAKPEDARNLNKGYNTSLTDQERLDALRQAIFAPGHKPDPETLKHLNGETFTRQGEASRRTVLKGNKLLD